MLYLPRQDNRIIEPGRCSQARGFRTPGERTLVLYLRLVEPEASAA